MAGRPRNDSPADDLRAYLESLIACPSAHLEERWSEAMAVVFELPSEWTPIVQRCVRQKHWKMANNPIDYIRGVAFREGPKMEDLPSQPAATADVTRPGARYRKI